MKKKMFGILTILFILLLALSLVACSNDYEGNATITLNLQEEYKDFEVNCPSAKVKKITNKQYVVELNQLLPVDIILTSEGHETLTLQYTTARLKKEKNIVESVKMNTKQYQLFLSFDKEVSDVKVLNYQNLTVSKTKNEYVLKSNEPLKDEVVLSVGEKYENVILYKPLLDYYNYECVIKMQVPIIAKNSGKVALFAYNATGVTATSDAFEESSYIEDQEYNVLDIKNYLFSNSSSHNDWVLIEENELQNGYYFYDFSSLDRYNEIIYKTKNNITVEDYVHIVNQDCYINSANEIVSEKAFYEGDKIYFDINDTRYLHIVTEEESKTHLIDLTVREKAESFVGAKFKIKICDNFGKNLIYDRALLNNEQLLPTTILQYDENIVYKLSVFGKMRDIVDKMIAREIEQTLLLSTPDENGVYEVVIKVNPIYYVTIKYVDIESNEVVLQQNEEIVDGDLVWLQIDDNYKIFKYPNYGLRYLHCEFGGEIKINIAKQYVLTIKYDQKIPYVPAGKIECDEIGLSMDLADSGSYQMSISITNLHAGKTVKFVLTDDIGIKKCYFDVTLPNDLSQGENVVMAKIIVFDNEW